MAVEGWERNKFVARGQSMVKNKERGGGVKKIALSLPQCPLQLQIKQLAGWINDCELIKLTCPN